MPAPTALQRNPEGLQETQAHNVPLPEDDSGLVIAEDASNIPKNPQALPLSTAGLADTEMPLVDMEGTPRFAPEKPTPTSHHVQTRKVPVPPHRMSPLKREWPKIYPALVEHLKLQVRMNTKSKAVELRTSKYTTDAEALQRGADFISAFTLGFDIDDAIALLRLNDLFIQTFEIKDVKNLQGEHLSRVIGRLAGKDGKTKFAIENTSRTRVVLADQKIHILGGFKNIGIAREAIVSLILGAPPGKVYGNLRTVASRMKERF
ncbi:MAG: hypothetical protein Q9227_006076 [Pyrenula ochraceoflavens]